MKTSRRDFLKFAGAAGAAAVLPVGMLRGQSKPEPARPNILFILGDDLGWSELGCYGNTFNETPNLDRLAAEGMRFTDAYAAAPVCSPYRAALMTGQYPARVGITDFLRPKTDLHLSLDYITLPEALKKNGYVTGIVGKWHLSGYVNAGSAEETLPDKHGFDEVMVSENRGIGNGSYWHPYHFNREIEKRIDGREYLVDRCNLEAVEFIERHKDKPFFLYLSHYAVHTALAGRDDLVAKYQAKAGAGEGPRAKKNNPHLAAQLEAIDEGVGRIVRRLDELGIADNTIVIFTGDNGGESNVTDNGPLREGKSTLYEGGIRVPLIVRWPGHIRPGTTCSEPTANYDFYPTLLDCARIRFAGGQSPDGVSLRPVFAEPDTHLDRVGLYWHYPLEKPHFLGGRSSSAVRIGRLKLIEFYSTGEVELYDLAADPGEERNVARTLPEEAARLKQSLDTWRKSVGAAIAKTD
ncbi:MAG: sulfatase [Phycisphaerae bacterium]|nr:sulfatase [Phycisphaerae bacterium]